MPYSFLRKFYNLTHFAFYMRLSFLILTVSSLFLSVQAAELNTTRESFQIDKEGAICEMQLRECGEKVEFRQDKWKGPAFEGVTLIESAPLTYKGSKEGIDYELAYEIKDDHLVFRATVHNTTNKIWMPDRARLTLGLNTYMEKYPDWNRIYFPTLMRSERTHFWGYFMSPEGRIISISSPDQVASWSYAYEQSPAKWKGQQIGFFGQHRIFTVNMDLLHKLPLPARHPQNLYALPPGQSHTTRFVLSSVKDLPSLKSHVAETTQAPVLEAEYYTQETGKTFSGKILTEKGKENAFRMEVRSPRNEVFTVEPKANGIAGEANWTFTPLSGEGIYLCSLYSENGKVTESSLYVRPDCRFYLKGVRKEALRSKPTATHHAECFYPLYTYFLAKKHVPDADLDTAAEHVFQTIFPKLFDSEKKVMSADYKMRIQDAATMAGILSDRYQVTGDIRDMENAAGLVEFLLTCQKEDGAYYNLQHNVHYTSVIYIAKSIMEVMNEEKKLAEVHPEWAKRYKRHLASVRAAVDNLQKYGDNIQTEGQMTFEDGMISCSIAQLTMAALKETDAERREKYLARAEELSRKHECLTQLAIPDCRLNGGTLRFWEYQYTINLMSNGMNSPCGWSGWKIYGDWYLYLLTGKYEYLRRTFNALGSCMQLLDKNTGELRFGFIQDPYLDTSQYMEMPAGSGQPVPQRVIVGEQYLSQTSNWHKNPNATWRKKWGIDNFPHEIYKAMTEIALENAYIIEHENGSVQGVNCSVKKEGKFLTVTTTEPLVHRLHINLKNEHDIRTNFSEVKSYPSEKGMKWLGSCPDDLRPF